ncbi:MAG: periplasmic heavy metal sensor [Pseudomonadota bacterium]
MEDEQGSDKEPKRAEYRTAPWVRILLVASLAMNLLVVGAVSSFILRDGQGPRGGPGRPPALSEAGLGPLVAVLDPQSRQEIRGALQEAGPRFRALRDETRQEMTLVLAALRADEFDPSVFDAIFDRQAPRVREMRDIGQSALIERLADMTVAERRALADRMEEAIARASSRPKMRDKKK